MTQDKIPVEDRVSAAFQQLKTAAAELNAVSDELGKSISALETALKQLNLGISTWVEFQGSSDDSTGAFWADELGYAKVNSRWGIALRSRSGNEYAEEGSVEEWLFNDAPRAMRVNAVDRLPDLLTQLVDAANKTTERIRTRISRAQQVVAAISPPRRPTAGEQASALEAASPQRRPTAGEQARALETASPQRAAAAALLRDSASRAGQRK
jgi:hypothetical protein